VTTTLAWCRSRSSRLTAVVCSGRNRPHASKGQWLAIRVSAVRRPRVPAGPTRHRFSLAVIHSRDDVKATRIWVVSLLRSDVATGRERGDHASVGRRR